MAARRPPAKPEPLVLTPAEKRLYTDRLKRRCDDLQAFDPQTVTRRHGDPTVEALEASIDEALSAVFGHDTVDYDRYSNAAHLDNGPVFMRFGGGEYDDAPDARRYVAEGKARSVALLQQAIRSLEEQIADHEKLAGPAPIIAPEAAPNRKVFIVHGHHEGTREAVARFLQTIGFQPIILHEQANQGRTVIEKVEDHGDVGFAVVLLTPDDEGCVIGGEPKPRARQNVVLELGYFIGYLGRNRVCALKRGEVEIPSDFHGVVYETFDDAGAWKTTLARELQAAGHEIDWNAVMRM